MIKFLNKDIFEITIVVDTNDGDYVTEVCQITEYKLNKIKPLIEAIKNFKPYNGHTSNYPIGECCRSDLGEKTPQELYKFEDKIFELFEDYCPYNEYGFHTIKSIEVCPAREKEKLL